LKELAGQYGNIKLWCDFLSELSDLRDIVRYISAQLDALITGK